jgi:hypothetical protein
VDAGREKPRRTVVVWPGADSPRFDVPLMLWALSKICSPCPAALFTVTVSDERSMTFAELLAMVTLNATFLPPATTPAAVSLGVNAAGADVEMVRPLLRATEPWPMTATVLVGVALPDGLAVPLEVALPVGVLVLVDVLVAVLDAVALVVGVVVALAVGLGVAAQLAAATVASPALHSPLLCDSAPARTTSGPTPKTVALIRDVRVTPASPP